MFIRKVPHKNKKNRRGYFTYKLVESVRTERGPRQRDVLNLGVRFDLPREHWKELANCIEVTLTGQRPLFDYPKKISTLAKKYAREIARQQARAVSSDCFQRKMPDTINNFLNCLPGYAAFFTSGMTAVAS